MPIIALLINVLSFQCLWWFAVLMGSQVALMVCLPVVALHFWLMKHIVVIGFRWRNECFLIALCVLVGFAVECLFLQLPVWAASPPLAYWPPVWLLVMWLGVGISLHISFNFLTKNLYLAALLGAIFAPISYAAGANLSDTHSLASPVASLVIIAVVWAFVMPLLVFLANTLPAGEIKKR